MSGPKRRGKGAMENQRDRYLAAGLVQINSWVPKEKRNEILEDCARLRWQHLRAIGYDAFKEEENER